MTRGSILNLLFPLLAGLAFWGLDPAEEAVSNGYLVWFGIGAGMQVAAALILVQRTPVCWKAGSTLLWLAVSLYMGGYTDLYLQENADDVGASTKEAIILLEYAMSLVFVSAFYSIAAVSTRRSQESYGLEVVAESDGRPVHE